jgi:hypothetical protein
LPLVDDGAASLKESWLRLLFIDNKFPMPETQIPIYDEDAGSIAFLDMGWPDLQLAVEYDGDQHRSDRRQYLKDRRRIPMVERQGWELLTFVHEDSPKEIVARTYEAYLRRGGAEIDELAWVSRTFAPNRWFGREGDRVA